MDELNGMMKAPMKSAFEQMLSVAPNDHLTEEQAGRHRRNLPRSQPVGMSLTSHPIQSVRGRACNYMFSISTPICHCDRMRLRPEKKTSIRRDSMCSFASGDLDTRRRDGTYIGYRRFESTTMNLLPLVQLHRV